MGIDDRDYVRRDAPQRGAYGRGGFSGLRTWSLNTWIIVACVAVFLIDGFLPLRPYNFGQPELVEGVAELPENAVIGRDPMAYVVARTTPDGRQHLVENVGRPILAAPDGPQIGWQPVRFMRPLQALLHFSTERGFLRVEFWRLIGFQFLHAGGMHLLFNMIGLFFFGPIVENYLGRKRYLAFYLLCGIFGALMYVALNIGGILATQVLHEGVRIPGLLFNNIATPLVGASAGVFGVLMAGAFLAPNAVVLVLFFIPLRLQTFAYLLVAIAFVTVLMHGQNAGGEAGHLGGAIAGWYFVRHAHHLHGFFDLIGWIDPTSHHYRGRRRGPRAGRSASGTPERAEVDRILDKIHAQGIRSLSERERRILHDASHD